MIGCSWRWVGWFEREGGLSSGDTSVAKSILSPEYGKAQGEVFVEQGTSLFISENEVVILCRRIYNKCEKTERSRYMRNRYVMAQ